MLHAEKLLYYLWAEAMIISCHIHNRATIRSGNKETLYELRKGRKPNFNYFHVFGSKCYIMADREQRRKMDPKSEEGIFLSYSTNSKAYIVYNKCSKVMMEFINMVINDTLEDKKQEDDEFPPQQTDVPVDDPSKDSDIVPEITYSNDL